MDRSFQDVQTCHATHAKVWISSQVVMQRRNRRSQQKMGVLERWFPNQCEAKIRHQSEESGEQFLYKVSNGLVWNFWIPLMKMNCDLITNFVKDHDAFQALI